jgi:hypothetical protein
LPQYQYNEIDPVELLGDRELQEVVDQKVPMILLGGDSGSMFFIESHPHSDIVFVCRGGYLAYFDLEGRIELSKFDTRQKRVLLLVKKQQQYYLYIVKVLESKLSWRSILEEHNLGLPSDVTKTPVAVSTNGEVAFNDDGQLCILNLDRKKSITKLNIRLGGQGCFMGKHDKYFAYCGAFVSEIAIAKRGPDGWIESELLSAKTPKLFGTKLPDVGCSNLQDLGTDGENLIVRVESDDATDELEGTAAPNVLWVFSLGGEKILESR